MANSRGEIKVLGAKRLRATLKKAGDDLTDLQAAHARAAQIAAARARQTTPIEHGLLRNTVRSAGTKTAAILRAGTKKVPWANPVHWGWGRKHIHANPWMSRAARETEPEWMQVYIDQVQDSLSKIEGA